MIITAQEFILVLLLTMPSGEVEEFVVDSGLSLIECKAAGQHYASQDSTVSWSCEPEIDQSSTTGQDQGTEQVIQNPEQYIQNIEQFGVPVEITVDEIIYK